VTWWRLWHHQPKPVDVNQTPELMRLQRLRNQIDEKADAVQAALDRLLSSSTEGHPNGNQ
jgi:hypothetical protein